MKFSKLMNGRSASFTRLGLGIVLTIAVIAPAAADEQKDHARQKGAAPAAGQSAPAENKAKPKPPASNSAAPPQNRTSDSPRHTSSTPSTPSSLPADRTRHTTTDTNTSHQPRNNTAGPNTNSGNRSGSSINTNRSTTDTNRRPVDNQSTGRVPNTNTNRGIGNNRDSQPPVRTGSSLDRNSSPRPDDRRVGNSGSPRPVITRDKQGRPESFRSSTGSEVRYHPDGRVGTIHKEGMTIQHGAGNSRRIIVERKDHTVIVTNRSGHGYIQKPFAYRGHEMVTRTYYLKGQAYNRFYRPYSYHGMMLNSYVPTRYYHSGFYGYFNRPWGAPVYYQWGWAGSPWYGYYRGYFSPYPYYSSPSLWLTDYIISARLAEEYADRPGGAPMYGAVMLSPSVKQYVANEVQYQLDLERMEADAVSRNEMPDPNAGFPRILSDSRPHVFVVSFSIDVTTTSGQGCPIGRGDIIRLPGPPPGNANSAYMQVMASKPGSCPAGSTVMVALNDLQDIYNHMRESLSLGIDELRARAGQNGVPPLPPGTNMVAQNASFVSSAPPPDPQVANELQQEVRAADQVEQQVTAEAGNNAPPATVSLGQSTQEVIQVLGNPKQIMNLGSKQIYVYQQMKITFLDGRVTDVQ